MNLSTRPPNRSTSIANRVRQRSTSDFTVSWSSRSATDVYPERSAKRTVTVRRCSVGATCAETAASRARPSAEGPSRTVPQAMQKRDCAGVFSPQLGHVRASEAPQAMQKRATAAFAAPHSRQLTSGPMTPQIFARVAIAVQPGADAPRHGRLQ